MLERSELQENKELWDLMQQDEVAELDTSAALEGLDLASSIPSPPAPSALSPDLDQPHGQAAWTHPASQGSSLTCVLPIPRWACKPQRGCLPFNSCSMLSQYFWSPMQGTMFS